MKSQMPGVAGTPFYVQQQRLQFLYYFGLKVAAYGF